MKYTREQDVNSVVSSIRTGKPEKKQLIKRLMKKYGPKSVIVVMDAYLKTRKRKHKIK